MIALSYFYWGTRAGTRRAACAALTHVLLTLAGSWLALPAAAQPTGKRVAFVVGNANYANEKPLANPHSDARLLAAVLRSGLRFDEVTEHYDLNRSQLFDLVSEIRRKAQRADAVVVYFSGHGMRGPGGNYLIPVDARITAEEHLRRDGVSATDLVDVLSSSQARVALLVLDACRDNPYGLGTKSTSKGLERMHVSGGNLLVSYATQDGQTADDGRPGNSPYARALAQHLGELGKPLLAQLDGVRRTTRQLTSGRQNPTREGDLEVDVYLVPPPPVASVPPVPLQRDRAESGPIPSELRHPRPTARRASEMDDYLFRGR